MTVPGGTVEALKAELKTLGERRRALEQEVAARAARLEAAGVGMSAALVDREGYPRADVDVAAVRADRHQVIVLSNDHKALTSQMEQLLHQLHAQSRDAGRPAAQSLVSTAAAEPEPAVAAAAAASSQPPSTNGPARLPAQPFAVVDEVSTGSPASSAGIQLGDQLCAFGSATASSRPSPLQAVAAELQTNVGRPVQATFLRAGAPVELTLTPQPWGGRGLLGCHLRPL